MGADVHLVSSRIESVTAYRKGARVLRVAEIKAEGGAFPAQIRLGNLPLALDDSSLKVRLIGVNSSGIPIASNLKVSLETPPLDASLPPAEDPAHRAVRIERDKIFDRVEQNRIELARLDTISIPPRHVDEDTKTLPPVPTDSRLKLLELRKERYEALLKEKDWLQLMKMDAERKLLDIQSKLARESNARQAKEHELRKAVTISLRASGAAGATAESALVSLEYLVPGARWVPTYTFRFSSDFSSANVSMRAMVCQRTGENWSGAKLTLSTANMQSWTDLPELNSLRIGRKQAPVPRRGWRTPPVGAEELFADFDKYVRSHSKPAKTAVVPAPVPAQVSAEPRAALSEEASTGEIQLEDIEGIRGIIPALGAIPYLPPLAEAPAASAPAPKLAAPASPVSRVRAASASANVRLSKSLSSAPADKSNETRIEGLMGGPGGGVYGADTDLDDTPGELRPKDQLLNFGRLRMPAPDAQTRGKLECVAEEFIYAEAFAQVKVEFTTGVATAIYKSVQRARSLEQHAPPLRCHFPETVDGFDYAYAAPAPVDIPSDGDFHSIPLVNETAESRSSFICVPREALDVYRYVEVKNPIGAPLLEGPADIHIGGDFLMTTPLTTVPPYGRVRLGLGVEQAIKVARNTTYAEESAGLIGGSLDLKHEIKIDVVSHLAQPVAIEIRERIPVLQEEEDQAKLTITSVSPDWQELKPENLGPDEQKLKGAYRWQIQASPGKSQQLRAAYTIQISAKNELLGGNRREH